MEDPQARLARMYVEEFLRNKGHTAESVKSLPAEQVKQIMTDASTYAAIKLAEVERRAEIVHELHDAGESD